MTDLWRECRAGGCLVRTYHPHQSPAAETAPLDDIAHNNHGFITVSSTRKNNRETIRDKCGVHLIN